jgi:hypothetical protein
MSHVPAAACQRRSLLFAAGLSALSPRLALSQGHTPAWPESGQWLYDVTGTAKGFSYRASGTLDWQHDGRHYEASLLLQMLFLGSRRQTSRGTVTPQGLRPDSFIDQGKRVRNLDFDWKNGVYRSSQASNALSLPPGAQDRLSLFLQLSYLLGSRKTPPRPGQDWSLPVLGHTDAQTWTFVWQGTETLDLPAGRLDTWKVARDLRHPGDTQIQLWFAPELGFRPVRIRLQEPDGDVVDQRLRQR